MRSRYNPIIILTPQQSGVPQATNSKNHLVLSTAFKAAGVKFRHCTGVYKGEKEPSYMIELTDENLEVALKIGREFSQESILVMDEDGKGELRYLRKEGIKKLGFLKLTKSKPEGDYTFVNDTNEYITFS